jgi:hypothetical protein
LRFESSKLKRIFFETFSLLNILFVSCPDLISVPSFSVPTCVHRSAYPTHFGASAVSRSTGHVRDLKSMYRAFSLSVLCPSRSGYISYIALSITGYCCPPCSVKCTCLPVTRASCNAKAITAAFNDVPSFMGNALSKRQASANSLTS